MPLYLYFASALPQQKLIIEFYNGTIELLHVHVGDIADHAIDRELLHVIWSFGQVFPDYFHAPGSGIEAGTASNQMFYQPDEIKYHGARNRGTTSINFYGNTVNINFQDDR